MRRLELHRERESEVNTLLVSITCIENRPHKNPKSRKPMNREDDEENNVSEMKAEGTKENQSFLWLLNTTTVHPLLLALISRCLQNKSGI